MVDRTSVIADLGLKVPSKPTKKTPLKALEFMDATDVRS